MRNSIATLAALSIALPGLALAQPMNGNFGGQKPVKSNNSVETKVIVKDTNFGANVIIVKDDDGWNRNKGYHNDYDHDNKNYGYGQNSYGQNQYGYNHYGYNQNGFGNGNYAYGHKSKITIYPPQYTKFPNKCGWGNVSFKTSKGYKVVEKAYMCRDFRGEWNIIQR